MTATRRMRIAARDLPSPAGPRASRGRRRRSATTYRTQERAVANRCARRARSARSPPACASASAAPSSRLSRVTRAKFSSRYARARSAPAGVSTRRPSRSNVARTHASRSSPAGVRAAKTRSDTRASITPPTTRSTPDGPVPSPDARWVASAMNARVIRGAFVKLVPYTSRYASASSSARTTRARTAASRALTHSVHRAAPAVSDGRSAGACAATAASRRPAHCGTRSGPSVRSRQRRRTARTTASACRRRETVPHAARPTSALRGHDAGERESVSPSVANASAAWELTEVAWRGARQPATRTSQPMRAGARTQSSRRLAGPETWPRPTSPQPVPAEAVPHVREEWEGEDGGSPAGREPDEARSR